MGGGKGEVNEVSGRVEENEQRRTEECRTSVWMVRSAAEL